MSVCIVKRGDAITTEGMRAVRGNTGDFDDNGYMQCSSGPYVSFNFSYKRRADRKRLETR